MSYIIVAAICLAVGFGIGRVKNAKKLAEAQAAIDKAKAVAVAEVKKAI